MNACVAVCEGLEFLIDKEHSHIYDIGISYADTIDFKIQEEQDLTEDEIERNPLMIEARNFLINQTKMP